MFSASSHTGAGQHNHILSLFTTEGFFSVHCRSRPELIFHILINKRATYEIITKRKNAALIFAIFLMNSLYKDEKSERTKAVKKLFPTSDQTTVKLCNYS